MTPLQVRWGFELPIILGLAGIAQFVTVYSRIVAGADYTVFLIIGGLMLLVSLSCLTTPLIVVESQKLTLTALFGLIKRKYEYPSLANLKIETNSLYYLKDGTWKAVPVGSSLVRASDWQSLIKLLASRKR